MTIAVTGASGFVGRHLVAALERRGISPVLVCRQPTRLSPSCGHRTVSLDVSAPPDEAFDLMGRPDTVVHLAWQGLPNYYSRHHFEFELPAHYRFLKGLVEHGLRNLVVTGTCAEYGMQSGPLSETAVAAPGHPYALAKHTLRRALEFLQSDFPFAFTWARLFYLFGEGQPATTLFSQLRRAAEEGARDFDMSGGEQLRDYLSVAEAAEVLASLAVRPGNYGCVNVCSGRPISVRALVERWVEENGWRIRLKLGHCDYLPHEPMAFWGVREKLDRILEDGILR